MRQLKGHLVGCPPSMELLGTDLGPGFEESGMGRRVTIGPQPLSALVQRVKSYLGMPHGTYEPASRLLLLLTEQ